MDYNALAEELLEINFFNKNITLTKELNGGSRGEDSALLLLSRTEQRLSSGELASKLKVTTGRMANILNSLEKKSYIERIKACEDKRQSLVSLTPDGLKYINAVYKNACEDNCRMLEYLGEDDSRESLRLIKRIACYFDQNRK